MSEEIYDFSVKSRDAFKAEVEEKGRAVVEIQTRMQELRFLGDPQSGTNQDELVGLLSSLEYAQELAKTNWAPVILTAPIDGMVGNFLRQPGEYILEGEPLVNIDASRSDHIVGYLRQPYRIDPVVGMKVQVTTRTQKRQYFWTEIREVGAQVETITNALAYIRQGALVDAGLPIFISVPEYVHIRPGEIVDLQLTPNAATPESNP